MSLKTSSQTSDQLVNAKTMVTSGRKESTEMTGIQSA